MQTRLHMYCLPPLSSVDTPDSFMHMAHRWTHTKAERRYCCISMLAYGLMQAAARQATQSLHLACAATSLSAALIYAYTQAHDSMLQGLDLSAHLISCMRAMRCTYTQLSAYAATLVHTQSMRVYPHTRRGIDMLTRLSHTSAMIYASTHSKTTRA